MNHEKKRFKMANARKRLHLALDIQLHLLLALLPTLTANIIYISNRFHQNSKEKSKDEK
jgi:hypothetical protein